jgi:4-nitrophenyl phosphatase
MEHLKNLIIDMDGVLWHGETAVPNLPDFFATLRRRPLNFVLATNNAAKTPEQYVAKLARFGVKVEPAQILTSAVATADFLQEEYAGGTNVYIIGGDGLHQAIQQRGFTILSVADVMERGLRPAVVVVGFWREASYADFAAGAVGLNQGARFIGTNPDVSLPSEYGRLPGAGSFLALLEAATSITPTVIGKPGSIMFHEALKRLNGKTQNTAMVGDRLNTDIMGGKAVGLQTILLLSGISTRADLTLPNAVQPDYVLADISELAMRLEIRD